MKKGLCGGFLVTSMALTSPAFAAEDLKNVLSNLMDSSARVTAARYDREAARSRTREAERRAWTPTVDLTSEAGKQKYATINNPNAGNDSVDRTALRATQLIYDFGRSGKQIAELESVAEQTGAVARATQSGVMLEALTAHWSTVRSAQVLEYSRRSEDSVRKQTQLENSLVEIGKGYESNVLQAKVQLATAEARRVRSEGALEIAQARTAAVYGSLASQLDYSTVASPVESALPQSLAEAKELALAHNEQIKVGVHRSAAIRERIGSIGAREFMPRVQMMAEVGNRTNIDGLRGNVDDRKVMLQFQYSFNTGMAGSAAQEAARRDFDASVSREIESRDLVLEQVNIAWRNLLVARMNRDTLKNQVTIANTFFDMASSERQLGRRSLLEVLTAEVSIINAQSDLATTEADVAIAGLTLLQAIGRLNMDTITVSPVQPIPPVKKN